MNIKKLTLYTPNGINNLPPRKQKPWGTKGKWVLQGEFGISSASDRPSSLKTSPFNTCVVLILYAPHQKVGGLAHFDLKTIVVPSLSDIILPEFAKRGCPRLEAFLLGGSLKTSKNLACEIKGFLQNKGIKIRGMDLFNPQGYSGVIFDPRDKSLYDLGDPPEKLDSDYLSRFDRLVTRMSEDKNPHLIYKVQD